MVKVYFETEGYAELAAIFFDEGVYIDCLPQLEREAKRMGFTKVTEDIEHSIADDELIKQIERL